MHRPVHSDQTEVDPFKTKTFITSRGFQYSYHLRAPSADVSNVNPDDRPLPALLFLHGFPTSSRLWRHQVTFFYERGFSICAPDLLGCGRTSKPTEPNAYRPNMICKDLIEILDAEGFKKVIAIGHGLGSSIVSRLANIYPERFIGYAFIAVPYCPPQPDFDIHRAMKLSKKSCGYELYGHILFYAQAGAKELIESNLDSFYNAMFPSDPKIWATEVAPAGALESWLRRGMKAPMAPDVNLEDLVEWRNMIYEEGIAPALCWHKALVSGINAEEDKVIPLERYPVAQPVFFAAANHDYISRSLLSIATTKNYCTDATIREFNDGHWLMMSSSARLNGALLSWIMDYT